MRRSRLALLVVVLCLLASGVPHASAIATGNFTFVGAMVLNGGLDYPCVNPFSKPCPPTVTDLNLGKAAPTFTVNGNARTGTLTAAACVGSVQNVNKLGKDAFEGPLCLFNAAITLRGYCGLAAGGGTGTFQTVLGQVYFVTFTFTIVGSEFTLRGNYTKTGGGPPEGDFTMVSDINSDVSTAPDNSCLTKTARVFFMAGGGWLVHPKASP